MRKITRTIKKDTVMVTMYSYDYKSLETTTDYAYEMTSKELTKHFEKKYSSVGKVVSVEVIESETLKVSMDIETFVSLATVMPAVSEEPEMPEPIVDKE